MKRLALAAAAVVALVAPTAAHAADTLDDMLRGQRAECAVMARSVETANYGRENLTQRQHDQAANQLYWGCLVNAERFADAIDAFHFAPGARLSACVRQFQAVDRTHLVTRAGNVFMCMQGDG